MKSVKKRQPFVEPRIIGQTYYGLNVQLWRLFFSYLKFDLFLGNSGLKVVRQRRNFVSYQVFDDLSFAFCRIGKVITKSQLNMIEYVILKLLSHIKITEISPLVDKETNTHDSF